MLNVIRVNAVKAYGGVEVHIHSLLTKLSGQINATAELQPPTRDKYEAGWAPGPV
jgi:hypothetical protein